MPPSSYDRLASHYDAAMRPLEKWFLSRLRQEVMRQLPIKGRILEVGAGTGTNFRFYRAGLSAVATEPSGAMLELARAQAKPDEVHLVQSFAEALPFADNVFDAAFATLVFCSVQSPQKALAELRRVVKGGGSVVLLEHVRPDNLLGPLFDLLSFLTVALFDDHFNRRTAEEARAARFDVVSVKRSGLGIVNLISCRVAPDKSKDLTPHPAPRSSEGVTPV